LPLLATQQRLFTIPEVISLAAQEHPILEIDANFPTVGEVTGVFEFRKSTVQEGIRTEQFLNNNFDQALSIITEHFNEVSASNMPARRGLYEDLGGGQHYFEIDLVSLGKFDGQWGYDADTSVADEATASGGDRIQKVQVFNNYLMHSTPDSRTPARLRFGGYAPGGIMNRDHVPVLIENPQLTTNRDESSTFTESLVCIDVFDVDLPVNLDDLGDLDVSNLPIDSLAQLP
jgi:hypothetical protein